MKNLLIMSGILTGLMFTPVAQAGTHYNCATATGCKAIEKKVSLSRYTETKYPVVLAHGLSGWTRFGGMVDYFYGIPKDLIRGGTDVFATKVSSAHYSEYRGEQLLTQVKIIRALTGKSKVNLVGHSHGGHDVRYVAGVAPNYVASATAVASPEQGSKMADWLVQTIEKNNRKAGLEEGGFTIPAKAAIGFFNLIGQGMDVGSGVPYKDMHEQDSWAALNSLTTQYTKNFNAKFPAAMPTEYCGYPKDFNVDGVSYYSFSGVGHITNGFDPIDYALALTSLSFKGEANDGLVSPCSSRLGYVIRDDYRMNHLDSVNQLLGMVAWRETNPKTVYRTHMNRLKRAGY